MKLFHQLIDNMKLRGFYKSIGRCTISCVSVFLAQFSISVVALFFTAYPLLLQLSIAVVVLVIAVGLGRCCRQIIGFQASAPAFVFFNIVYIWGVYNAVIRRETSLLADILLNGEVVMLIIGLSSIKLSDPGLITDRSSTSEELDESSVSGIASNDESPISHRRVRYCKICKAYIEGFDHHCPAFGNCIGQNNYVLFMVLLVGFITTEASYIVFAYQYTRKFEMGDRTTLALINLDGVLTNSTILFSLLQVIWQVVFLTWHIYCVCFNITTDEWVNWHKYSEFQILVHGQQGERFGSIRFRNPYDNGIVQNVKEFIYLRR